MDNKETASYLNHSLCFIYIKNDFICHKLVDFHLVLHKSKLNVNEG